MTGELPQTFKHGCGSDGILVSPAYSTILKSERQLSDADEKHLCKQLVDAAKLGSKLHQSSDNSERGSVGLYGEFYDLWDFSKDCAASFLKSMKPMSKEN